MTITATRKTGQSGPPRKLPPAPVFHGQGIDDAAERTRDLVTAIFDVLIETNPELADKREEGEAAVRHRLGGLRGTVLAKPDSDTMATRVLSLFNGRNAREVARKLGIGRASVYRYLKQAGGASEKQSQNRQQ